MSSRVDFLSGTGETRPLSISQLTARLRHTLESTYRSVWVEGEISNFKGHSSGHWYFTLVEQSHGQVRAQLPAVCFESTNRRIRFRPANGQLVRARGNISVYVPHGKYQLYVEQLEAVGDGRLLLAYEELKKKLAAEGLFDPANKRPLPRFPRRVGIVTSPTGAAIRDILNILSRRTRTVHTLISPTRVQGVGAANEIAQAIRLLNEYNQRSIANGRPDDAIDVIIVARGGGSLEDLWPFNEETVARSIRASTIPIISGIGHEPDITIADFAADKRASTPSAAAELVAEQEHELTKQIAKHCLSLAQAARYCVIDAKSRLDQTGIAGALQEVRSQLRERAITTDNATQTLHLSVERRIGNLKDQSRELRHRLAQASPWSRLSSAKQRLANLDARLSNTVRMRCRSFSASLHLLNDSLSANRPEKHIAALRLRVNGLASQAQAAVRSRLPSERESQHMLMIRLDRAIQSDYRLALSSLQDLNRRLVERRPETWVTAARLKVHTLEAELQTATRMRAQRRKSVLDQLERRMAAIQPRNRISVLQLSLNRFSSRLIAAMRDCSYKTSSRLKLASNTLDTLSPLSVLERGYAIAQDSGGLILRDAQAVGINDEVSVRLAKGKLITQVKETKLE
jgi:exodeoxyribonuclease VII large subunit